jgi:hypothetical protein
LCLFCVFTTPALSAEGTLPIQLVEIDDIAFVESKTKSEDSFFCALRKLETGKINFENIDDVQQKN